MTALKHTVLVLAIAFALGLGCAQEHEVAGDAHENGSWEKNLSSFSEEVQDLQERLEIPGIAYAVVEDGRVLASRAFGNRVTEEEVFSSSTPVNTQSISKAFAAVLALQLASEGQLDLTAPVHQYFPGSGLPREVQVEHLLTHTSEGVVGEQYIYSGNRYSLLQGVIEQAGGATLEELIRRRIIEPASMQWYDSPGMGTAWGLVSTIEELSRFVQALDRGDLLGPDEMKRLATPTTLLRGDTGPISLGWFAQRIQGVPVMWSYGQGADREDSSALLFRVPERKLTAVVLANTNTMSDWFRLLMGDARKSAFAMSFYRLFVASPPGEPLPRPDWHNPELAHALQELERSCDYSWEGELIGQALISGERGEESEASRLLRVAIEHYDVAARPDPVVHYATQASSEYAASLGIPMGRQLLEKYPNNRWILLTQGELLLREGDAGEEAADAFRRILAQPNQQPDFLHRLFKSWSWLGLAAAYQDSNPALARQHLRELLACEDCPNRDRATALLENPDVGGSDVP